MTQDERDVAMRILGARDGYVTALIKVRNEIACLRTRQPVARFVRKRKEWDRQMAPLLTLERMFDQSQKECAAAYEERMAETV